MEPKSNSFTHRRKIYGAVGISKHELLHLKLLPYIVTGVSEPMTFELLPYYGYIPEQKRKECRWNEQLGVYCPVQGCPPLSLSSVMSVHTWPSAY